MSQSCFKDVRDLRGRRVRGGGVVGTMREPMPRKPKAPTCEDCFFHRNMLCALELSETCSTFRPNRPEGLVPPRQPVLLMRAPRWAAQKVA